MVGDLLPSHTVRLSRAAGKQILTPPPILPRPRPLRLQFSVCSSLQMSKVSAGSHRMKLQDKKLNTGMGGREEDFPRVNCVLL